MFVFHDIGQLKLIENTDKIYLDMVLTLFIETKIKIKNQHTYIY